MGAVCASDIDNASVQLSDNSDVIEVEDAHNIISVVSGTFTDLQNDISADSVVLNRNYTYDSVADADIPKTGILIDTPKVIDGNGYTIDAMNLAKIFNVTSSDVTFKNIVFVNANASEKIDDKDFSDCGAAIVAYSGVNKNSNSLNNISIIDCTFKNCYSAGHGAVYTYANNVTVIGSAFEGNSVPQRGGAFYARGGKNITVSQSKFHGNYQDKKGYNNLGGGAIYLYDCEAEISDSSFDGNYAHNGGAIYVQTNNVVITGCNFTGNEVTFNSTYGQGNLGGGGAIFMYHRNNLTVSDCRFEENTAKHTGGAVYIMASNNVKIENSVFYNNIVVDEGGALYFHSCDNVTIGHCNITKNRGLCVTDDSYGGAVRLHESNNTRIHDTNFTDNSVAHNAGGAIEYHSNFVSVCTIENCNFNNNTANSDGGAIYAHSKGQLDIIGCNFTNNKVVDNQNVKSGGAILINLKTEDENNTAWDHALKTNILNCNFINNTAPVMGGAVCLRSNNGFIFDENVIENCTFYGNNATWGSAIFVYTKTSVNISNVVFGKNRANSTSLGIGVDKKISYYPSNVTVTVTFQGKDNIANAIWNGGKHSKNNLKSIVSADPKQIALKNVTYEIYRNGVLEIMQTPADRFVNPVKGYKLSENGTYVWQDTYENAQNITVEIYKVEYNDALSGVLSANNAKTETFVTKVSAPLTDIAGKMAAVLSNLEPGNYTAKAYHLTDAYYTEASNSIDFEIILIKLNVTKTTQDTDVIVGDTVTYNITVRNPENATLANVTVIEKAPESFELINNYSSDWTKTGDEFVYQGLLKPYSEITLTLSYRATKTGIYNNTVSVRTNQTSDMFNSTSENTTVRHVELQISKTSNVSAAANNTLVNFTITVKNSGDANASDVVVEDVLPEGLIFADAGAVPNQNVAVKYLGQTANGARWNVSELKSSEQVQLWITALISVSEAKTLTNTVNVTSKENTTEVKNTTDVDVLPVNLTVVKTTNLTAYAKVSNLIRFIITVTNNGPANATDITVSDDIMDVFEIMEVGNNGEQAGNRVTWTIAKLAKGESAEVYVIVNATKNGHYKNAAAANCRENRTNVTTEIPVIVEPAVAFEIIKTANHDKADVGENVTFTITVTNLGPSNATDVNVTDVLDDAFAFDGKSTTADCDFDGKTIVWHMGNMVKGSTYAVSFNVTVLADGNIVNVASVNSTENTTGASNKTNITAVPVVDLKIIKIVDKTNVTVGDEVTYTITVTNLGPSAASNVNVTENMIGSVSITDVKADVGEFKDSIWYIGTLNKDVIVKLAITVKTLSVGTVENIVTVNSTEKDGNNSNNRYPCENVTVNPAPSKVNGTDVNVTYGDPIVVPYESTNATNVTYEIIDENSTVVANGTVGPNGTVPVDQLPVGNYTVNWTTVVDGNHTPATNTSTITVLPIPTVITVGNITTYPGENIIIPINVTTGDGIPFNGNITVELPDGNYKNVEIVNGTGNVTWKVPEDYTPDKYPDSIRFPGNDQYSPSNGTGVVEVVKIPTHITVGNVTAYPGDEVTVPINVTADDGNPFSGNVTVIFPDGTVKTVEIINGEGSTTWTVPEDFTPDKYLDTVRFEGNGKYLASEGNGTITVLKKPAETPEDNETDVPDDGENTPQDGEITPDEHSSDKNAPVKKAVKAGLAKYETGNPILVLLGVLALLGVNTKRKN